jgi:hypothetical protein
MGGGGRVCRIRENVSQISFWMWRPSQTGPRQVTLRSRFHERNVSLAPNESRQRWRGQQQERPGIKYPTQLFPNVQGIALDWHGGDREQTLQGWYEDLEAAIGRDRDEAEQTVVLEFLSERPA